MRKAELIEVLKQYRNKNYKGCRHKWGSADFIMNQGIVFSVYKCQKCDLRREKMLGETWKPDEFGNF